MNEKKSLLFMFYLSTYLKIYSLKSFFFSFKINLFVLYNSPFKNTVFRSTVARTPSRCRPSPASGLSVRVRPPEGRARLLRFRAYLCPSMPCAAWRSTFPACSLLEAGTTVISADPALRF